MGDRQIWDAIWGVRDGMLAVREAADEELRQPRPVLPVERLGEMQRSSIEAQLGAEAMLVRWYEVGGV